MMGTPGRPGGVEVGYPPRTPAQARVYAAPGDVPTRYSTVEFIGFTSAAPFTLAQLKEFTLARGFKPSLHGATTLPVPSHPSRGG